MIDKWRPALWMVVAAILAIVVALPLSGLVFFRLYENQFVRQTEAELIAQASAVAAFYGQALAEIRPADSLLGPEIAEQAGDPVSLAYQPRLDLASETILPSRGAAHAAAQPADPEYVSIGLRLNPVLADIQRRTLAGFRVLDARGTVISGRQEAGLSLAHVPEVARAMSGHYASVIRVRISDQPPPPLYSISRGTRIRVFVAVPVAYEGRVGGVVYVSRTPSHILRHLYGERVKVALWAAFVLVGTAIAGWLLMRTVSRPVRQLLERTEKLKSGNDEAMVPLRLNGTREMAALGEGLLSMARRLRERGDYIRSYASHVTHELKSPLTAIRGAAELLVESGEAMTAEDRKRFARNIATDAERLNALVGRLRDHARAEAATPGEDSCSLDDVLAALNLPDGLDLMQEGTADARLAMSAENAGIVLSNLAANAAGHGAATLSVEATAAQDRVRLVVTDDGEGISAGNRARVFEPFFTTRRESGGTGMGLHIVKTLVEAHGGSIALLDSGSGGATFEIVVPAAR